MSNIFDEYRYVIDKVRKKILTNDRWSYLRKYEHSDRILLNLSFRGGWGIDFWFDDFEEYSVMSRLIKLDYKKVGSIVSQTFRVDYFDIFINLIKQDGLKYKILQNRWKMFVLFIYNDESITIDDLKALNNEYMDYNRMGSLYGYNNYKIKKSI